MIRSSSRPARACGLRESLAAVQSAFRGEWARIPALRKGTPGTRRSHQSPRADTIPVLASIAPSEAGASPSDRAGSPRRKTSTALGSGRKRSVDGTADPEHSMRPFFENDEAVERLEAAARAWVGTPFAANSAVCGVGVSCHHLVATLLMEAGYPRFDPPAGNPHWASHAADSLMVAWLNGHGPETGALPAFAGVAGAAEMPERIRPGDILGFRVGRCVHHLGLALSAGRFIHCLKGCGTVVQACSEERFARRLEQVWRPLAAFGIGSPKEGLMPGSGFDWCGNIDASSCGSESETGFENARPPRSTSLDPDEREPGLPTRHLGSHPIPISRNTGAGT